jgi:hypothetical protein
MKMLRLSALLVLVFSVLPSFSRAIIIFNDTSVIVHQLDGITTEWPAEKFQTDKETGFRFVTDNDNERLFLAVIITDKNFQRKITLQGLILYIDTKGKKKENKGVEFPIALGGAENWASQKEAMSNMKLIGFTKLPPFAQPINTEGTVNISAAWDSLYNFQIEYAIPLKLLEEDVSGLKDKKISIGWKINEDEPAGVTGTQTVRTTTALVGRPTSGGQPTTRPVVSTTPEFRPQGTTKPKYCWTTHTISF